METTVTKSKTIAAAIAALTLATTFTALGGQAQAHSHFGRGLGWGIAAGMLVGAAAASNSYYYAPGYRECRYVDRMDRWGNIYTAKVCDVVPY
jgi:anaerobic C4-dicarboxylate transporter